MMSALCGCRAVKFDSCSQFEIKRKYIIIRLYILLYCCTSKMHSCSEYVLSHTVTDSDVVVTIPSTSLD